MLLTASANCLPGTNLALIEAGIDKSVIAKHAKIEEIVLSKLDDSSTRLSLSSVSKGLNTGDFAVDHMSTQDSSVSIKQIVKDLDNNIIPFSLEFISQTKKHEIAEQIFNLEEKFTLHSQRISGVEVGQVGASTFNLSVSNESNKSVIKNELSIYQDIRKINHLTNNRSLYQQERQEIAFAVLNNKHLFNQRDLADMEKSLISDRDQFINQARELLESEKVKEKTILSEATSIFVSSSMSISQMYAALDSCDSQTKIKLARSLNDKINNLSQLKQELCVEIKSLKTSILEAKNRISIADYKSELLNNYLGKVYRDPSSALLQWQVLAGRDQTALEESLEEASTAVKLDFRILGEPVGHKFLGLFSDATRKQADALGSTISSKLVALENDKKQKQENLATLEHYEQNKTLAALEKDLSDVRQQLGWIPNNSRVMNEIRLESVKELDVSLHLELDKSLNDNTSQTRPDNFNADIFLQKEDYNHEFKRDINFSDLDKQVSSLKHRIKESNQKIESLILDNKKIEKAVSKVYNPEYGFNTTIEIWNNNIRSIGIERCEKMLNQNPTLLSELKGTSSFLGLIKDKDRILAEQLSYNIGTTLRNYTDNLHKIDHIQSSIESLKLKENYTSLDKTMSKSEIKEIIFKDEYKRIALSQDTLVLLEQIQSIEKVCFYAEKYSAYPGVLEKSNSRDLVYAAEFEIERYNSNKLGIVKCSTVQELINFDRNAEIKAAIQTKIYLTHDNLQPYQASQDGEKLFNQLQLETEKLLNHHLAPEFNFILKSQIMNYSLETGHMPDQKKLLEFTNAANKIHIQAQELSKHLDQILDSSILNHDTVKDHRNHIAALILTKNLSVSAMSIRETTQILNQNLSKFIQSKEQEKTQERDLDLELTR